jgi:hypothetical protein
MMHGGIIGGGGGGGSSRGKQEQATDNHLIEVPSKKTMFQLLVAQTDGSSSKSL